nr:ulp1 protease family, C-terminal catalytic domain-containing protein [Tanacetum cinerariifolium]
MRAELKAELGNEMKPEQNLFSPREDDVPNSVHMKSSLNSTTIIEETYYCLYIPSFVLAGEKVACDIATVYPIGDGTVHFKKFLKGHMKVSVIKVVEIHKSMELPMPNDEIHNLESVVKGFIQWPIAAIACFTVLYLLYLPLGVQTKCVMPQHKNAPSTKKGKGNETLKEPNKQDRALEETNKHQKTMQKISEVKEQVEKEKSANRKSL